MSNFKPIGKEEAMKRIRLIPRRVASCRFSNAVRVTPRPSVAKKEDIEAIPRAKLVAIPKEKPQYEKMTEKEERLADLLEAAQEVKPIVDEVAEEQSGATEPYDDPEFIHEQDGNAIEEASNGENDSEQPPPSEEKPKKKRRGRKGKRGKVVVEDANGLGI